MSETYTVRVDLENGVACYLLCTGPSPDAVAQAIARVYPGAVVHVEITTQPFPQDVLEQ